MKLWTIIEGEIAGFSRKFWVIGSKNLSVREQMNHKFPPKSVDRADYEPGIFICDSPALTPTLSLKGEGVFAIVSIDNPACAVIRFSLAVWGLGRLAGA